MNMIKYKIASICNEIDNARIEIEDMCKNLGMSNCTMQSLMGGPQFRVDIQETGNEVIVIADLPGIDSDTIDVRLINSRALEISGGNGGMREEHDEKYYLRERIYKNVLRVVTLPTDVRNEGYSASFKNSVLEVHMTKAPRSQIRHIEVKKD